MSMFGTAPARLLITIALLVLSSAAEWVRLPGVDPTELARLQAGAGAGNDTATMSVVSFGLGPLVSGFLLVEAIAWLVPRWRRLRSNGPAGRRKIRRWAVGATLVFAAVQGFFFSRFLHQKSDLFQTGCLMVDPGLGSQLLVILSLVAGVCFLLTVAELIDQFGLGSGVSCLLGAEALGRLTEVAVVLLQALADGGVERADVIRQALLAVGVIVASVLVLGAHRWRAPGISPEHASLRTPTSGLFPLTFATAALALPGPLSSFGIELGPLRDLAPGRQPYPVIFGLLALGSGFLLSLAFYRRRLVLPVLARAATPSDEATPAPRHRRLAVRAAIIRTLLFLGAVSALGHLLAAGPLRVWPDPILLITITAVVLDLGTEWRARRRHGPLVAIWLLNQVALVQPVVDTLARAGIFVLPRTAFHRALLQALGPYLPIVLLVPEARAAEARGLVQWITGVGAPTPAPEENPS
jgi:hypothetical protein